MVLLLENLQYFKIRQKLYSGFQFNDLTTSKFFRCTNKKDNFLKQILERDFRMCEYETNY